MDKYFCKKGGFLFEKKTFLDENDRMTELSIILTSYNYAHYLSECIESILYQNYSDYELIIIDDASKDNSVEIIKSYASLHTQIKLIERKENKGPFNAVAEAICESSGRYLYLCAADDKLLPDFLPLMMDMLKRHPELKMVCSDFKYFNDHSAIHDEKKLLNVVKSQVFSSNDFIKIVKSSKFWVPGPSVIFAKELWEKYGGFDSKLVTLSDWFFFQRIALFEGIGYIPKTLAAVRLQGQSFTSQIKQNKTKRRAMYRHLLKQLAKDDEARILFEKSGLLDFIFRELFIRLLINPLYRSYWPYMYRNFSLKIT